MKAVQRPLSNCLMVRKLSASCDDPLRFFGELPSLWIYDGMQPGLRRGLAAPAGSDL